MMTSGRDVPSDAPAVDGRDALRREPTHEPGSGGPDNADRLFDRARETMPREQREAQALAQLKIQLRRCYSEVPFYRRHWTAHGFHPDQVLSWDDFTHRCPVIDKSVLSRDQEEHPPYGSYLGIDPSEIVRIQASTGTSGRPTVYGVSAADWRRAGHIFAITQHAMGVRAHDVVHFAFPFSLFFGGWGTLYGAECLGAAVLPLGFADTRQHLTMLERVGSTVIEATPSYLLHMAEVAREIGMDPASSTLRRAIVGGEPGGAIPSTRRRIMEAWGLESVCDSGSTSEMFPFCTNSECTEMLGPHLFCDEVWTEIVDPANPNRGMPEGEHGAVVYTHLWRESQPMIRFASKDGAAMTHEPCPCGRTYPRLPQGVLGRFDDMLVVRGVNVFPSAIERTLGDDPDYGGEFRIYVTRKGRMDEIAVEVETLAQAPARAAAIGRLTRELKDRCQIRIPVTLVEAGTFERATLKARRIIDQRGEI
jgi:phenylacetate-CoA ligase